MKIKIYQSFFDHSQINLLTPEFTPFDNSKNDPDLRETGIQMGCYTDAIASNTDIWGVFSWKWKEKLPNLSASQILSYLENNPGYDVYFFNPFSELESYVPNMWEQGQNYHPNMLAICKELFPYLGLDVNLLYEPMSYNTICWSSFYLGNKKFWDEWLALIKRYLNCIEFLPESIKKYHNSSANYIYDTELWYFPFIQERLFSTFILANKHRFLVKGFSHGVEQLDDFHLKLRAMKHQAVEMGDLNLLKKWNQIRFQRYNPSTDLIPVWEQIKTSL